MREKSATGESDEVVFRLMDDGCGVDLGARHAGVGLIGIRERVAMLGGGLQVTSEPAHGFQILARIPVRSAL
jgi:signal transduction histidine kinase